MKEFIQSLREIAFILKKFGRSADSGAKIWNGEAYVLADNGRRADPYALAWWMCLESIANLLEAQEIPLTNKQRTYLAKLLFGTAGSLHDFALDVNLNGNEAIAANKELMKRGAILFKQFKSII